MFCHTGTKDRTWRLVYGENPAPNFIMIRPAVHLVLHVFIPGVCARIFFKQRWWKAWAIMVLTMVVDIDHLLGVPIYDPNRCSINYHPLHSYPAIFVYVVLAAVPRTRLVGLGLLIHMGLDFVDCVWQVEVISLQWHEFVRQQQ